MWLRFAEVVVRFGNAWALLAVVAVYKAVTMMQNCGVLSDRMGFGVVLSIPVTFLVTIAIVERFPCFKRLM